MFFSPDSAQRAKPHESEGQVAAEEATLKANVDSWIAVTARKNSCAPAGYRLGRSGVVQLASLGRVQICKRRVSGNGGVRVITEPLQSPVPDVSMKIVWWAGRN